MKAKFITYQKSLFYNKNKINKKNLRSFNAKHQELFLHQKKKYKPDYFHKSHVFKESIDALNQMKISQNTHRAYQRKHKLIFLPMMR